jgi:hypothetical protein
MDQAQTRIIELLREVHLLAIREVERLNIRIVELESQHRQPTLSAVVERPQTQPATQADEKLMNESLPCTWNDAAATIDTSPFVWDDRIINVLSHGCQC